MELGKRMKQYEYVTRNYLPCRMPVIVRIDGKAFHSFTKGFMKPYDYNLSTTMAKTTAKLVENIQGCVFGYTQSDEISLLLKNDQTIDTTAFFDNNISKILSITASAATLYFNRAFEEKVEEYNECWNSDDKVSNSYLKALDRGALFDSRCFVLPENEIVNYFIWRQEDASKNSIQMLAQANFSHKELQGLNGSQLQDKLMLEKNINWNDVETRFKRGTGIYKKLIGVDTPNGLIERNRVHIDTEIPIFSKDRDFIENFYRKSAE